MVIILRIRKKKGLECVRLVREDEVEVVVGVVFEAALWGILGSADENFFW